MQLNKSFQNLSEISGFSASEDILLSSYQRILKSYRLNGINRMLNGVKSSGISGTHLFQTLFVLPFLNIKIFIDYSIAEFLHKCLVMIVLITGF